MLFGRDRICAVVAARTAKEMARQLRRALRLTRTVELRLDWLRDDRERLLFVGWLGSHHPKATLIGTCRRRLAGGRFPNDI
ncbi:MAG TPA: hypothetical protein VKE24_17310, partial [Candidatus Acidoferrales bacterium]|nr:hypothetical protein [Candidatus Acidoferrales bacterium]